MVFTCFGGTNRFEAEHCRQGSENAEETNISTQQAFCIFLFFSSFKLYCLSPYMIDTNKNMLLSEGTPMNPPGAYPEVLIITIIIIAVLVVVFLAVLPLLLRGKGHTPVFKTIQRCQ